jgi:hypothetical protein
MSRGSGALDFVDEGGYCVNGAVVRSRPKLEHQEEAETLDVSVDSFGNDLLE